MKTRLITFDPTSLDDIAAIEREIKTNIGPIAATRFADRLLLFCTRMDLAAERGMDRSDIRPGLRVVGFERPVTIAFVVMSDEVLILRVFAGGRDWERDFADTD